MKWLLPRQQQLILNSIEELPKNTSEKALSLIDILIQHLNTATKLWTINQSLFQETIEMSGMDANKVQMSYYRKTVEQENE